MAGAADNSVRARRGALALGTALALLAGAAAAQPSGPESADQTAAVGPQPLPVSVEKPASEERGLGAPAPHSTVIPRPDRRAAPTAPATGGSWLTQTALSLGGVVALAMIAAGAFRFLSKGQGGLRASLGAGGRSPAGIMEILGRYPVGRGATLVLLKLDRRILLLSQTAGGRLGAGAGFQTLCEITDPEEVASILVKSRDGDGDSMSEKFRSILGRFDRSMDHAEESTGRRVAAGPSGDRVELWDERNPIPVVDLTKQPGPPESGASSLRRRLASMRIADDQEARA